MGLSKIVVPMLSFIVVLCTVTALGTRWVAARLEAAAYVATADTLTTNGDAYKKNQSSATIIITIFNALFFATVLAVLSILVLFGKLRKHIAVNIVAAFASFFALLAFEVFATVYHTCEDPVRADLAAPNGFKYSCSPYAGFALEILAFIIALFGVISAVCCRSKAPKEDGD